MPCWFAVGKLQKTYWDSLLGLVMNAAAVNTTLGAEQLDTLDLLPSVRACIERDIAANQTITQALLDLLTQAGLIAAVHPGFAQ